ncbi:NAD-binding protein [Mycobacterium kiyosense]|nr:NAD-binding protein [Mycobacterium kiyosense]
MSTNYRWHLTALAVVVVFVLGCIGYGQFWHDQKHIPASLSDAAYWSLRNFFLNSPNETELPVTLDLARFLAPLVGGYVGLAALAVLFRDRAQQMRIPLMRRHIVVCGLGYVGAVFLRHLHDIGASAVVIEADAANPNVDLCRNWGVPVIVSDARLPRTLRSAGVQRASRVVAVTSSDAVNAEIVAVAGQLTAGRSKGRLTCLARVGDPELCALLRLEAMDAESGSALDFFNTDEISARLMLSEFPVDAGCVQPHMLVADFDVLGAWVVYHAARHWHEHRPDDSVPLVVTIVDSQAERRIASLVSQHPALEPVCRFICLSTTVRDIRGLRALHADAAAPPLTRAYVTAYRDEEALEMALKLRQELDPGVPIVVALARAHGMSRLLDNVQSTGGPGIHVFPTLVRACTVDLIQGGSFETIAQAIHRRWCAQQTAAGMAAPSWSELDESRKESSRAYARHIAVKLRAIGYDIAPLRDWFASDFVFSAEEEETLAVMEHDRWVQERIDSGWTPGDKDAAHKKTPYLVPFADLPPDIAEYDRVFVREIPRLLASVGMQIVRTPERGSTDGHRLRHARSGG